MSVFFRRRGEPKPTIDYKTWLLNDTISSGDIEVVVSFESNNQRYHGIDAYFSRMSYKIYYDDDMVYTYQVTGNWSNQAYRTVTFDEVPTGELRAWLEANATPI